MSWRKRIYILDKNSLFSSSLPEIYVWCIFRQEVAKIHCCNTGKGIYIVHILLKSFAILFYFIFIYYNTLLQAYKMGKMETVVFY